MIASCDIETACGVQGCPGYDQANSSLCSHAVHTKLNKIKIIGVFDEKNGYTNFHSDVAAFDAYSESNAAQYVFHNGKFDWKTLKHKGSKLSLRNYIGDTQLAGACVYNKVTDGWLKMYNEKRAELNAFLPPKQRHRVGTQFTLKTMAPYYLRIEPFWENPTDHDDEEYNAKDCEYTFYLHKKLLELMEQDKTTDFYHTYLMQWQKLVCEAEYEGLLIDTALLYKMYAEAIKDRTAFEEAVHEKIQPCFEAFKKIKIAELTKESTAKCDSFCKRLKDQSKVEAAQERYAASLAKKVAALPARFNLNSPKQMLDILTWAGIDTLVEKRRLGEMSEEDQTDKFVLIRAEVRDNNELAGCLLRYREKETEVRYLKQYIEAVVGDRIYGGFSLTGTRTGRLSSSGPNLQNIKGSLRLPFIIADPSRYSIYTVDSSQIEPRVIAYLSKDKAMVELFANGRDFHNYATKLFFPNETKDCAEKDIKEKHKSLRNDVAKHCDLSGIYGTGPDTLIDMILLRAKKAVPRDFMTNALNSFKERMEHVFEYKRSLEGNYNNGVRIYDNFGFPVVAGKSVFMTLFNSKVQGMSSRMIFHASFKAFVEFREQGIDARPLAWVHDEVIWRFPKGMEKHCQERVDYYMTHYKLNTPHGVVPLGVEGHLADRWQK